MTADAETVPSTATVDRMVHAAVTMLERCRVTTVEVDEIADAAGIDRAAARQIFPDSDALDEAIGTYGVLKLSDALNRALVAVPSGDNRGSLIALGQAYVRFARQNPTLYNVLTTIILQPKRTNTLVHKYDASFVPLVRRLLDETDEAPSSRAGMARAFLYGMTDLALGNHLSLWLPEGEDHEAGVDRLIVDFVDMLVGRRAAD